MDIGFVWDETKYKTVVREHNVNFYEVVAAIESSQPLTLKGDGLMNIMEDDNFDYQAYTRETPPDPAKILRGTAERQRRFDTAMTQLSVRLDEDVLEHFRQLTAEGQSVERLINRALREWLSAQGMKELVRVEVQRAVQQSLSSAPNDVT